MLIAEIGNNFFGSMEKAKEMIRAAHDAGADVIKGQAFVAADVAPYGSMPAEFYEWCQLKPAQYLELIAYARSIGTDMFYSIFSESLVHLERHQLWTKRAAGQTRRYGLDIALDHPARIISVAADFEVATIPRFREASVLFASNYLDAAPPLERIQEIAAHLGKAAGYSCHAPGVATAVNAVMNFDAAVVEKHFTLEKNLSFQGIVFRDTVHAADPEEFEILAKAMKG